LNSVNEKLMTFSGKVKLETSVDNYRLSHEPPLYLNILNKNGFFHAFPSDMGGGIRGGDVHTVELILKRESGLFWEPPASLISYPSMYQGDRPCGIFTTIVMDKNSWLCFLNKPMILCKDSMTDQITDIAMNSESSLFYWEIFCPGRIAYDEKWELECFKNKLRVSVDGKIVYRENWSVAKGDIPLSKAGFWDNDFFVNLLVQGKKNMALKDKLIHMFHEFNIDFAFSKIDGNLHLLKAAGKDMTVINKVASLVKDSFY
jgi:urease accessory protein UreH